MANTDDALTGALTGPPAPDSAPTLVEYLGGRPQLARAVAGVPGEGPLPARGTEGRRRYNNALRQVQRWTTSGAERRKPRPGDLTLARKRAQTTATKRWLGALNRRGARVRIVGQVRVDSPKARGGVDRRHRELPAGGPGQYLAPDVVRGITSRWTRNRHAAAEDFLAAFFDAYGLPEGELDSIDRLKIWPDGQPEPR